MTTAETVTKQEEWEPKIMAYCCNWCSYAGADLAGTSRIQYPTNARILRVNCTGRISPEFILAALDMGADGCVQCVVGFWEKCHGRQRRINLRDRCGNGPLADTRRVRLAVAAVAGQGARGRVA